MSVATSQFSLVRTGLSSRRITWPPLWLLRDVLAPFVLTRLALSAVGLLATGGNFLEAWSNWDGHWYLDIAQHGYSRPDALDQSNTAFAPALPLLMRLASLLFGPSAASDDVVMLCGFVVVNAALLVALAYLVALVRQEFDAATASRAALYVLVFPSTLFFSAVYPHAVFLAGAVGAFYYARHKRWWLAGLFGALAALARVQGCAIVLPLALEYFVARNFDPRRTDRNALALLLPLASFAAFASSLWLQVGDPLAMLSAQGAWNRHFGPPWEPLLLYLDQGFGAHGSITSPLDLAFTLLLLTLVALSWVRLRRPLALFSTLLLTICLSSGQWTSTMRFGLELFPIFIVLAISGRFRLFHYAYLGVAGYMALRFMSQFAQNVWVA